MNRRQAMTPMMSDSFMIRSSSPSSLASVPDDLPNSLRSPVLTSGLMILPVSSRPPGPTAITSPCDGFSLGSVGNDDAALRFFLGIDAFHDHPVVQGTELGFGHM